MIDICKRLRQLREAKGRSHGGVARRSGMLRPYICRVECGHTIPQVETLTRWTKAPGITQSEFFAENITPQKSKKVARFTFYEKRLFELLRGLNVKDRRLILSVANMMAKQRGNHG
jgi:transcriptional regulator with XRE-family HTH domain